LNEKSQRGSPSDDTDRKEYIELAIICIFINKKVIGDEKSIGKRKTGMSYPEWHRRVKKEYRVVPSNSGWLSNRCKRKDIKKATGLSDYSPVRDKRTEIDFSGFLAFNTCAVGLQIASGWKRRRWQIYVVQFVTWWRIKRKRDEGGRGEGKRRSRRDDALSIVIQIASRIIHRRRFKPVPHTTEGEMPDRMNALPLQRCCH